MTEDRKPMPEEIPEEMPEPSKHEGKGNKVGQALLWAAAMIGSALLLKGTDQADNVFWLLFVLAVAGTTMGPHSMACERRAWRKLMGKSD